MRCPDVAAALVDERLPRPADFQAHLDRCAECRALASLHRSATALDLPSPPPMATVPREAILGEVRRRHHRRRVVAGTAVTGALAALVLNLSPLRTPAPPSTESPPLEGEPASIGLLMDEVYGYTRSEPSVGDETYRPFGALAAWIRPPESTALDSSPFRTALAPLHPPSFNR